MWKSRFRCLLYPIPVEHKLATKIIYTTAILHNMLVAHAGDRIEVDASGGPEWIQFFEKFKSHRCPECVRKNLPHCVHQAVYRNGAAQQKAAQQAGSEKRIEVCQKLWNMVCAGSNRGHVEHEMLARAQCHAEQDNVVM